MWLNYTHYIQFKLSYWEYLFLKYFDLPYKILTMINIVMIILSGNTVFCFYNARECL